jgi:hypothetical protein
MRERSFGWNVVMQVRGLRRLGILQAMARLYFASRRFGSAGNAPALQQ